MSKSGLILFAHGARDERWVAPMQGVAAIVRATHPQAEVRLAFLELMQPDLVTAGADLAACGCDSVQIVPLFLGVGGHLRNDLPRRLAALEAAQPGVRFTLHPAIGEMRSVVDAIARAAAGTLNP